MSLENKEIEFKYSANNTSVSKFKVFCEKKKPLQNINIFGQDRFYEGPVGSFYRHRRNIGENQLTFKKKSVKDNNYIRTEHNINLGLDVSDEQIEALMQDTGYRYDFTLHKSCVIYNYEYYTLVYYVCYDDNMSEVGRFIEIELKEDYKWESEDQAMQELYLLEKLCAPLGIDSSKRVKQSLYEMYRKVT